MAVTPETAVNASPPEQQDPPEAPPEARAPEPPGVPEAPAQPPLELTTRSIVEAVLFAADAPLAPAKLAQIVGVGDARDMRQHVAELNDLYARNGQSFRIEEVAGGFQMLTLPTYNTWLTKLVRARTDARLSPAALETLAIVAYKQPVLRADIEDIRGVQCGEVINRLREMNLVKIVGRAEDLGRPMLYGTTKRFLEVFGLANLDGLPQVEQLKAPE